MSGLVAISGCSGGGKSTLLEALAARGHHVVEEPGRRIVREEQARGGDALPWIDMAAFLTRVMALAQADVAAARGRPETTFFDRGIVDAWVALRHLGIDGPEPRGVYHRLVFLAPPWPEIYGQDAERRHGYDEAVAEHDRLAAAWLRLGHQIAVLPRTDVASRADFVLARLDRA